MRRLATTLSAVALLACTASAALAAYKYPPGPPYRTCPDSVTIYQAQMSDTLVNPCYPAASDTVLGMRGIITGFRLRSTGRIYMENSNAADYNGIQVYTVGHTETQGLAIGDSISVCGVEQAYQNETQIQGTLGTTLTVRQISTGNPLPPFRVGTTTDYKWTPATGPGSAFATCDPREGCLVKINGPLKVARNTPGAGLYSPTNWLLVNSNGSAPGDSVIIDGYTLTAANVQAPPLNYTVNWVQGILRRATNANGVDCWLITLRNGNDQSVQAPPNLSEAYPIADNKIRLIFDANVDVPTAEIETNYTLGSQLSGSTVDLAEVVGGSGPVVDLTITDVRPRMADESIQSQNIGSETCPACLSSAQSRTFILGLLTIMEIQAPNPDSLGGTPCLDKSRFAGPGSAYGTRLTLSGTFVQNYGNLYYLENAAGGQRSGISVYNPPAALTQGRRYLIAGAAQEYYTETEIYNVVGVIDDGPSSAVPIEIVALSLVSAAPCDAGQSNTNAEDYEGVLVKVQQVRVVPFNTDPQLPSLGGSFRVVNRYHADDTLLVSALGNRIPTFQATVGEILNVTGVIHIDNDVPRILPRSEADIEVISTGVEPQPGALWLNVRPNPGTTQRVSFALPWKGQVDLGVYDVHGRRVAQLARGEFPAGEHTRIWNGLGPDGKPTPAGVYFFRLAAGKEIRTFRAIKLN